MDMPTIDQDAADQLYVAFFNSYRSHLERRGRGPGTQLEAITAMADFLGWFRNQCTPEDMRPVIDQIVLDHLHPIGGSHAGPPQG